MIPERVEITPGLPIEGFTVQKRLGEGGFGSVFLVKEQSSGKLFALKILRLWEIDTPGRDNILSRFELEFQTGKISSPYLVHNHSYGKYYGNPYIVMDFCPNGDLRGWIEKQKISDNAIPNIGVDILHGISSLHENGKIHRDLKPENILFDQNNHPKLADFGIAGHANLKVRLTQMGWRGKPVEIFGTYMYMPPEQAQPKSAHVTILPTVDIFAFGVMMYELYAGQLPFGPLRTQTDLGAYVMNAAKGTFPDIKKIKPSVPDEWANIISTCLKPDYKQRPQGVNAILDKVSQSKSGKRDPVSEEPSERIMLVIMQGEEHGKPYHLDNILNHENYGVITIGRNDDGVVNDINVKDDLFRYISRRHATIERIEHPPYWIIKDGQWGVSQRKWIPSTNGTYVNSKKVDCLHGTPIFPGQIITIGDTTLKVERQ